MILLGNGCDRCIRLHQGSVQCHSSAFGPPRDLSTRTTAEPSSGVTSPASPMASLASTSRPTAEGIRLDAASPSPAKRCNHRYAAGKENSSPDASATGPAAAARRRRRGRRLTPPPRSACALAVSPPGIVRGRGAGLASASQRGRGQLPLPRGKGLIPPPGGG
jgi:hypothetical protein